MSPIIVGDQRAEQYSSFGLTKALKSVSIVRFERSLNTPRAQPAILLASAEIVAMWVSHLALSLLCQKNLKVSYPILCFNNITSRIQVVVTFRSEGQSPTILRRVF
eukprot:sb/3477828/